MRKRPTGAAKEVSDPMAETVDKQETNKDNNHKPPPPSPSIFPSRAFSFWAYLALAVALVALLSSPLRPLDHRSWFLSLPADLRRHFSHNTLLETPIKIFAADNRHPNPTATVLLLHGLASSSFSFRFLLPSLASHGLRAIALDLPGSGFSQHPPLPQSPLARILLDIRSKGVFWAFDHLVETGHIPYRPPESSAYGPAELGRVLGEAVASMGLPPLHLVLHDSALAVGANWVSTNPRAVLGITLLDASESSAAFPSWILGVPVLGGVLLRSRVGFAGLLRLCCSRTVDGDAAEAYRLLLKKGAVVAMGNSLNHSFDLGEWAASEGVRELPMQTLWSNTWNDYWIDEGRRVAASVPRMEFAYHSGGRWPQEDAAEEIAGMIAQFVLSLPKFIRQPSDDEPLPEHS